MIVTIHQPNLVPWMPFFQKMAAVDVFVVLTHCQFEKNNYQNRFQLNGGWMTMPVHKGMAPICEKRYIEPTSNWERLKMRVRDYRKQMAWELDKMDTLIRENLAVTNVGILIHLACQLSISTKIVLDQPTDLRGTERLVKICQDNNADTYLAGPTGAKYLDVAQFQRAGIDVQFQDPTATDRRPVLEVLCA